MARGKLEPGMVERQIKPAAPVPKGAKLGQSFGARLPVEVADFFDGLPQPDRVAFIRRVLTQAGLKEMEQRGLPLPDWASEFNQP